MNWKYITDNNQLSKVISVGETQAALIKVLALSLSVKIIYLSKLWYFHLHSEKSQESLLHTLGAEATGIYVKHVEYTKAQHKENNY